MAGTTVERDVRRQSRLVTIVCWLTPLAVGLLGVVLLRLRMEAVNDSNLDAGGRFRLLGAVIVMPLTCYAAAAIAVLLTWPRQAASRYLWLAVALASGLAVSAWLLMFGRA
jgi:hypothetical protein